MYQEEKKYIIYKHTNKINGKVYIGQTCQKPQRRWGKNGNGYKGCPYFYRAIQKYGWENFSHQILEENLTAQQANIRQIFYIQRYQSTLEDFGYNNQKGGAEHSLISETAKQKHRQKLIERWKDHDFKEKMSKIMKQKWQDPEYRNKIIKPVLSQQLKQKIKQASLKSHHWNEKPVICLQTNESFKSSGEAGRTYNINSHNIRSCCSGNRSIAGGYHWLFLEDYSDIKKNQILNQQPVKKQGKKIRCKNNGKIFLSLKDAAKWCGLAGTTGISAVLTGKRKYAGKDPDTGKKLSWEQILE